ncbi:MAG TPA: hypothetical protein VGE35_01430 [Candidatus Paceibacterota bacterium]
MAKELHPYEVGDAGLARVSSSAVQIPAGLGHQVKPNKPQLELLKRLQSIAQRLETADLIEIITAEFRISEADAREGFRQVITFLWLSLIKPAGRFVTPAPQIDEIWKLFILQTETYRDFQNASGIIFDRIERTSRVNKELAEQSHWMSNQDDVQAFLGSRIVRRWWIAGADI